MRPLSLLVRLEQIIDLPSLASANLFDLPGEFGRWLDRPWHSPQGFVPH